MKFEGFIRLGYFILMLPVNWLTRRWLWDLICKTAGVTKQEVWGYWKKVSRSNYPERQLCFWMLSNSKEQRNFKKYMILYQVGNILGVISINLAILSFFTHAFDQILNYTAIICLIAAIVYSMMGLYFFILVRIAPKTAKTKKS